jgi:hypothetical protein
MSKTQTCIIDNWSLEHAGHLLDHPIDYRELDLASFIRNLGGLSNYINALLLYEQPSFMLNGFEKDWKRFKWFDQNTSAFMQGLPLDDIDWQSKASYSDKGIANYLLSSRYYQADLFVTPERSEVASKTEHPKLDTTFRDLLDLIERRTAEESSSNFSKNIRVGVKTNFALPSLTHYVFSEASNANDLFKVIMQLKADGKIRGIIDQIETISSTTKGSSKLQQQIEYMLNKAFGKPASNSSWSLGVSAYWLSISKTIDLNFFNRKEYMVFLRHLVSCRTEAYGLKKHIERIFQRQIEL